MTALLSVMICLAIFPQRVVAQEGASGVIIGSVINTDNRSIENAEVLLEQLRTIVRTSSTGRFTFVAVKDGKYTVTVRAIGYETQTVKVTVRDSAADVVVRMVRAAFSLPATVTTASRGGLSGVVADTGFKPLANVWVRVMGFSKQAHTDSTGKFFLPVPPGKHLVRLEREGFARQLIGVSVSEDEGREIAAWLVPQRGRDNPQVGANLFDLNMRILRMGPATSTLFSREDIDKLGKRDVLTLVRTAAGYPVSADCRVLLNGGPITRAIWELFTDNVEFVEIVQIPGARQYGGPTGGSRDGLNSTRTTQRQRDIEGCMGTNIGVWTREG